jgi:hypothetical protein
MVERIEVREGQERSTLEIVLVNGLAQILAFTQQNTPAKRRAVVWWFCGWI